MQAEYEGSWQQGLRHYETALSDLDNIANSQEPHSRLLFQGLLQTLQLDVIQCHAYLVRFLIILAALSMGCMHLSKDGLQA